ncbi:unnamed protein product [Spirodela intermedia]|uniref:Uncharacterized protein n=1 Tax=Spirodela intermedia TaxID=51605 RepID=A0A7I8ICI9_SPIIN|nr:unnamed protein product [Spirodela intermedia]CAA6654561.1 unnamed protein product [Spirodela intermedia]
MAFHGTDGFSVFDCNGKLAFRVDNYARRSKCAAGDVVLMDGDGRALLTLRPQCHDQWNCLEGDGGSRQKPTALVFSMRRRRFLQSSDEAEVFVGGAAAAAAGYRVEGSFRRRSCKILRRAGGTEQEVVVAEIRRKMATSSVALGDDVFCLIVQPHAADVKLLVAFIVVMDRICRRHRVPLLCS